MVVNIFFTICFFTNTMWVLSDNVRQFHCRYLLPLLSLNDLLREGLRARAETIAPDDGSEINDTDTLLSSTHFQHTTTGLRRARTGHEMASFIVTFKGDKDNNSDVTEIRNALLPTAKQSATTALANAFTLTENTTFQTSPDAVYTRSKLYLLIKESMHLIGNHYEIIYRSCKNRCGLSKYCSCKPICKFFKTCCVDFYEECGDTYCDLDDFHERLTWLDTVNKQCLFGGLVVNSCSPMKEDTETYLDDLANVSLYFRSRNLSLTPNRWNQPRGFTSIDALMVILYAWNNENLQLDAASEMLISTPLLDTSTGISYRNISMYVCNGASLSHAKLWSLQLLDRERHLIVGSQIEAVKDIFSLIKLTKEELANVVYENEFYDNIESCNANAIATCPDSFYDDDVERACENVLFHVTIKGISNNFTSIVETYKNLFCLNCNRQDYGRMKNKLKIYLDKLLPGKTGNYLKFDFSSSEPTYHFLVKQIYDGTKLTASWTNIECSFLPANDTYFSPGQNILARLSDNNSNDVWSIRTTCHVEGCLYNMSQAVTCLKPWILILYMPPTQHRLTDKYLQFVLDTWKQLLLNTVPVVSKETIDSETFFSRYQEPEVKHGHDFSYAFFVSFHAEVDGFSGLIKILRKPVTDMLMESGFPFQWGKAYACFTTAWGINSLSYCADRTMVYLPIEGQRTGNTAQPMVNSISNCASWFTTAVIFIQEILIT